MELPDIESMLTDLADKQARIRELDEQSRARRFTATSEGGAVTATVDGTGSLHDLDIPDRELRVADPSSLGRKIVSAVATARSRAIEDANGRFAELLPGFQE